MGRNNLAYRRRGSLRNRRLLPAGDGPAFADGGAVLADLGVRDRGEGASLAMVTEEKLGGGHGGKCERKEDEQLVDGVGILGSRGEFAPCGSDDCYGIC